MSADSAFKGSLVGALYDPEDRPIFDNFLTGALKPGRLALKKAGTYRIRVYVYNATDPKQVGAYSFRLTTFEQDVTYPIVIGTTVSDGVPTAGAGRIAALSEEDFYTFTGQAGQNVVFEDLGADASFHGKMAWALFGPDNSVLFDEFLTGSLRPGRQRLPSTGTYKIRAYVYNSTDRTEMGAYSFRLTALDSDKSFTIRFGDVVSDGFPAVGAGRIAAKGEEDIYTISGKAGQSVVFEDLAADTAFKGQMAWILRDPSGTVLFDRFVTGGKQPGTVVLPRSGAYTLRAYVYGDTDASQVGTYSFRTYIRVFPRNDRIATIPGIPVEILFKKILFNDTYAEGDAPVIDLPQPFSEEEGEVTTTANAIRYTPPTGFNGVDRFTYRLSGQAGGVATATVSVYVASDANQFATVVGMIPGNTNLATLCLQALPSTTYQVESSKDYNVAWSVGESFVTDATGGALFNLSELADASRLYLRFRKK